MRLAAIDLNLLTALDALLDTRSVTLAAGRLGVTQPATSHALRRLRDLLGDPLLVRAGAAMRPTPRALELAPLVRAALDAAARALAPSAGFDPATAIHAFALEIVDQASMQLLPPLLARLRARAPGVRLDVRPTTLDRLPLALATGDLDLAIGVFRPAAGFVDAPLWHEEFQCVLRRGSAAARGPLTLARYLALAHLMVAPRGTPGSYVDDELARRGLHRHIALTVPHFLVAPHVVAATDLIWTAPGGLARAFAKTLPLTVRPPPLPMPGFDVTMRWHTRLDHDPALTWLRGELTAVGKTLNAPTS